MNDDFIRILKSLDVPAGREGGYTFHSLQSSFKTIAINAGVPKQVADAWQNHAPPRAAMVTNRDKTGTIDEHKNEDGAQVPAVTPSCEH